jgi:hypothetical protein
MYGGHRRVSYSLSSDTVPYHTERPRPTVSIDSKYTTKPWKYLSYKAFSGFIAFENELLVIKRFSTVNSRNLSFARLAVSVIREFEHNRH